MTFLVVLSSVVFSVVTLKVEPLSHSESEVYEVSGEEEEEEEEEEVYEVSASTTGQFHTIGIGL